MSPAQLQSTVPQSAKGHASSFSFMMGNHLLCCICNPYENVGVTRLIGRTPADKIQSSQRFNLFGCRRLAHIWIAFRML